MNREDKTAATHGGVLVELPLGDAAPNFNLEKSVCSHGLFMMAPNHWDPHSKTLKRPLRPCLDDDETSLMVHISHPPHSIHALHLRVFGTHALSPQQQQSLLLDNVYVASVWSRTLSMAQALCELQAELQHPLSSASNVMDENGTISSCQKLKLTISFQKHPQEKNQRESLEFVNCLRGTEDYSGSTIGNFPSPRDLARLDEKFLERRCNLGYRARRVINFARQVIEGRVQLKELEFVCGTVSLSDYDKLTEKLRMIDGIGPYTCANVLMCMGYYHVIPADSETIRHLKQVHAKSSTIRTVQEDIENIYGKYAPFQFLAYWSEMWQFYEERFGNLSVVPHSSYKLITAANMRPKKERGSKRTKLSVVKDMQDGFTKRMQA
ncbi:hypothetical protein DH2020_045021 [Rehmannia glutinosa]|uniref:HhH-GPD domain-containing protein n=1 Tax=Rehmannia glutinosa TaxID=99300 RepID=A0ABR0UFK5_REHGL